MILIGIIFILLGSILIFLSSPYSYISNYFQKIKTKLFNDNFLCSSTFIKHYSVESIKPIQEFIAYSNKFGVKHTPYIIEISTKEANFPICNFSKVKRGQYKEYHFADAVTSISFSKSSIYGLKVEKLNILEISYVESRISFAKFFLKKSKEQRNLRKDYLILYLSRCLFSPNFIHNPFITWTEIDDYNVKATLKYIDIEVSGMFTFHKNGQLISFFTTDRDFIYQKQIHKNTPWTLLFQNYREKNDGHYPSRLYSFFTLNHKEYLDLDLKNITYTLLSQKDVT